MQIPRDRAGCKLGFLLLLFDIWQLQLIDRICSFNYSDSDSTGVLTRDSTIWVLGQLLTLILGVLSTPYEFGTVSPDGINPAELIF